METAGDLVAVLAELAAGVEDRQHDLEGGAVLLLMHAGRDAAAVVLDPDGVIFVDRHEDLVAEAGHRLVDTVVYHFVHQVVEAPLGDVADIHRGSLAHGLKPFEHLDTVGGILLFRPFHLFVLKHFVLSFINEQIYKINFTN